MVEEAIARLRAICTSLPDVEERLSHGEPAWFIKGKRQFATFAEHHHDTRIAVWCAAPPGFQEAMVQADPTRFFRPPYVGPRGWLGISLDAEPDWTEVEDILTQAHGFIASKKK